LNAITLNSPAGGNTGYVYVTYLITNTLYSIIKLTYAEGKMMWSKNFRFIQNRPEGIATFHTVNEMHSDSSDSNSFFLVSKYYSNNYFPVITKFTDSGTTLASNF
jgi:hypothetical protein